VLTLALCASFHSKSKVMPLTFQYVQTKNDSKFIAYSYAKHNLAREDHRNTVLQQFHSGFMDSATGAAIHFPTLSMRLFGKLHNV
jgi:hypothetical protein